VKLLEAPANPGRCRFVRLHWQAPCRRLALQSIQMRVQRVIATPPIWLRAHLGSGCDSLFCRRESALVALPESDEPTADSAAAELFSGWA